MPDEIRFYERVNCPSCGSMSSSGIWSGKFSDADVLEGLEKFHYSADLSSLGDRPFSLRECSDCGQRYHRFVIDDASVPVIYGKWIDTEQAARFERESDIRTDKFEAGVQYIKVLLRLRKLVLDAGANGDPVRLLDFGCGNGELLRAAHVMGMECIGIDVSADRRTEAGKGDITVYSSLAEFDASGTVPVDAVVLNQVLEHLTEPVGLLKSLRERMKPAGILFVAVPNCKGIAAPKNASEFHSVQPIEHVNAFTPESLEKLVCRVGFERRKRPAAFVTAEPLSVARTAASLVYFPANTDQFFQRL